MFEGFTGGLEAYGLIGLFLTCFLSATILPLSSELLFIVFLNATNYSPLEIFTVASLGNCLGGLTNYALGYFGSKLSSIKPKSKAFTLASKYGFYAAFFSWLPFIGDPLLVVLGFLKSSFWKTVLLMCLGKCLRYLVLMCF